MARFHSILAAVLLLGAPSSTLAQPPQPSPEAATPVTFTIFMSGAAAGSEQVTVTASADGWVIGSTGRIGAPLNLTTSRLELRYDREWKPRSLEIDATLRGQPLVLRTAFANGKASSSIIQNGQETQKTSDVAVDTIVMPNMFFGVLEALSLRLASVVPGGQLKAFVVPQVEIGIRLDSRADERIKTASRTIAAKRYALSIANPGSTVAAELWADEHDRLLRFRVPAQSLDVAREDVAVVSSRFEQLARPTDEQASIQASGFTLAATISKPLATTAGAAVRWPAVILVPGSGQVDRDETVAGVAVFAQLANAFANAGFVVARFDKRGVGQSGGRDESATIADYAEDVRAVLTYVSKRKDVDPKRVALVGHSEGGFVSLLAASEERKRIAALALIATPATTGAELVLEQQRHLLNGMNLPDDEKQRRIDLQKKIQAAVISGDGWDQVPPSYKRQADTAWFRSFLTFDPARTMRKVTQPLLIVQGERDRQVDARHGPQLAGLARARKNNPGSELSQIKGINHLLVPAVTGEVDEYASLQDRTVSPVLISAIADWLKDRLHVDPARPGR